MKTLSGIRLGVSVGLFAFCVGCSHTHRVVNTGDSMLYGVTVQSGEKKFGYGYLPPKAFKSYNGSMRITRSPAPIVSWKTTENGEPVKQDVKMDSEPRGREVVFELDGKTVRVTFNDR